MRYTDEIYCIYQGKVCVEVFDNIKNKYVYLSENQYIKLMKSEGVNLL